MFINWKQRFFLIPHPQKTKSQPPKHTIIPNPGSSQCGFHHETILGNMLLCDSSCLLVILMRIVYGWDKESLGFHHCTVGFAVLVVLVSRLGLVQGHTRFWMTLYMNSYGCWFDVCSSGDVGGFLGISLVEWWLRFWWWGNCWDALAGLGIYLQVLLFHISGLRSWRT